jgi:type IV fimbrial biogenesis protein FimT
VIRTRSRGFTLTELMVALVIVGVLAAIAAPSYREFMQDTRMSGDANEFLTMVNFARSEAIKRDARVTMCRSADGATCADAGGWEQGYVIYVDASTAGTLDNGDTILRVHGPLNTQSTLTGEANKVDVYISFIGDGRSMLANDAAQAGNVDLCNKDGFGSGRRLELALGRAQVTKIAC